MADNSHWPSSGVLPRCPEAGERERRVSRRVDQEGRLAPAVAAPLVEAVGRDDAAPAQERAAEDGARRDGLAARVDVACSGRRHRLRPRRHKAPAMHLEGATVVALDDDGNRLRRRDVIARAELIERLSILFAQLGVEYLGQLGRVRPHRHPPAHHGHARTSPAFRLRRALQARLGQASGVRYRHYL